MSAHDSAKSADTKNGTNPHGYFVPVVVTVVLSILIVSTFYDEEFDTLVAGIIATDQARPVSNLKTRPGVKPKSTIVTETSSEAADTAASSDRTIHDDTTAASEPADDVNAPGADATVSLPFPVLADVSTTLPDPGSRQSSLDESITHGETRPSLTPADTGSASNHSPANNRQDYLQLMDERRKLYQQAIQARRAHMMEMLEYRAEVRKRIEQDRRDLYRYREQASQQHRENRDRNWSRLGPARDHEGVLPI